MQLVYTDPRAALRHDATAGFASTKFLWSHLSRARRASSMYGCSIDRIGNHRIVHVFDEFTDRTATKLVEMIRSLSSETDGRIILSLLESREVDPRSVHEA